MIPRREVIPKLDCKSSPRSNASDLAGKRGMAWSFVPYVVVVVVVVVVVIIIIIIIIIIITAITIVIFIFLFVSYFHHPTLTDNINYI